MIGKAIPVKVGEGGGAICEYLLISRKHFFYQTVAVS
jgi:hypothetical protein